jgi:hypothetical protein
VETELSVFHGSPVIIILVLALVAVHLSLSGEMDGLGVLACGISVSPFLDSTSFIRLVWHVPLCREPTSSARQRSSET